jgi:replicative DNA helicase
MQVMNADNGDGRVFDDWLLAETQLVGRALLDQSIVDRVGDVINETNFQNPVHKRIWAIIANRHRNGHPANLVAVAQIIGDDPDLEKLGGKGYLVSASTKAVGYIDPRETAQMMIEGQCRFMLRDSAEKALSSIKTGMDSQEVSAGLLTGIASLPETRGRESSFSLARSVTDAVTQTHEAYHGRATFLKTGIGALDDILRGLAPGDLCLLGGTTSMGKTATAIEIAANVAFSDEPGGAVFWSLEMWHTEIANRIIAARSSVAYSDLRDASKLDEKQFGQYVKHAQDVEKGRLRVVPKNVRDMAAGHAAIKRAAQDMGPKCPLRLVVVDYAQLVRGEGKSRYEQMTNVSIGLKSLAGVLGVPVIALVQLDRSIGEREDRRPHLFDIKETGQFENDADQVVFCNREEYWLQRMGPKARNGSISAEAQADWEADKAAAKNKMELIVRKNRHGRVGMSEVGFHAPTNRFWSLAGEDPTRTDDDGGFQ